MKNVKYAILEAGPSGLTLAHALLDSGLKRDQIVTIERDKTPGGLCRSEAIDGAPLDIGGGHLDIKNTAVLEFLLRFMPREGWTNFDRVSKIRIHGMEDDHPLEANL